MSNDIKIRNKRASYEFELIDKYVCGMVLKGTEIKSIRMGKATITETFCFIKNGEMIAKNIYIAEYEQASFYQHEAKRDRKLLLKKKEIEKIDRAVKIKGHTIIATKMFISKNGYAKIEIAIAKGKKLHDKREDLKLKDDKRQMDRALKNLG